LCHDGPVAEFFEHLPERIVPVSDSRPGLPATVERADYRGLGLRIAADRGPDPVRRRLERDPGCADFAETAEALAEVRRQGIEEF